MTYANGASQSDKNGNLLTETDALGNKVQYAYTPEGWLSSVTKADGAVMTFEYDKTGALTRQNVGDGQSVTSSYNEIGKLTEVSSEAGTIRYQYNEQGFLISVENVNGDVVSYTYDAYGNKTSMTYPDGRTVSYTYDAMNRMAGVVGLDGETTSYVYDAVGRRIQTVSGNMTTRYAYDSVGNLTEQATSGASDIAFRYSYDRNGYITGEKRTENGTETENSYAYNALGELTSFLQSTGYGESYAYDKAGNMLEKAITGTDGQNVTLKMAYNAANQLTGMTNGQSKIAYSYDKNGSLIQKTLTSKTYGKLTDRYAYDALDQLTSYVGYDGYQQQFTYDANGMRLSKKETGDESRSTLEELLRGNIAGLPEIVVPQAQDDAADVPEELAWATTDYLYDITQEYYQVISETRTETNGHTATTAYAYGLERIAAYTADSKTSYVYDGRGSVAQAVTAPVAGEKVSSALPDVTVKVQSFSYTAFGEQMSTQKVSGFAYNAEAYDAVTDMINLRARQYEPTIGRFEQKDPGKKSSNEMLYCDNSPIRFADFDGYEIVVISGNVFKTPPTEGEREIKYGDYNFISSALGEIRDDLIAFPEENIGWLIADDGWIEGVDKPNFEEAARELGGERIKITYLKSAESCTLYVNSPSREVDKITKMAVFSHGIVNEGGTIKLGYSTHNNELDIDKDVIKKWNRSAFRSNAEVYLQSCNLGNSGQSLAKVMSDSLNVIVYAYAEKSDYSYIDYPPTRKILNRTTLELVDVPVVKEMNKLREANKDKGFIPTGSFWPPQAAGFSTKALKCVAELQIDPHLFLKVLSY